LENVSFYGDCFRARQRCKQLQLIVACRGPGANSTGRMFVSQKTGAGASDHGAILPDYHSSAWQHVSLAHPGSLKTPW
jgi:hypothetical protein